MLQRFADFLDDRTGYRRLVSALLLEHIPGGARWRYVWGSCLAFVFAIQLVTGVMLMTAYSPGDSTAWASVYFIQYQMDFGWLLRGLHHFGSQTMVVLLGLHMLQVVIAGAHLPPREVNWWLGLGLMGCVLALSLTGYLLPWDQKGYWATQVATSIAGNLPVIGPWLQKIIVGGTAYGHATLTRFYALHVGILPPLVIVLIIAHLAVFRRHGVTTPQTQEGRKSHPAPAPGDGWFWPDQAFRDLVASLAIFGVMLGLVVYGHGNPLENPADGEAQGLYERIARAGQSGLGANLDAPADPATPYPARPEWYFLFLFQLLKYFEGPQEVIGTVVIPAAVGMVLFVLPLLGYGPMRRFGHGLGVVVVAGLLGGAAWLTYEALAEDRLRILTPEQIEALAQARDPALTAEQQAAIAGLDEVGKKQFEKVRLFQVEMKRAERLAARAVQLASAGVPADGAVQLLRRDPMTRGRELFREHCASCHTYGKEFSSDQATASDLAGFGTAEWIRGLLRDPADPRYLGRTNLKEMARWVKKERGGLEGDAAAALDAEFDLIAKWLGRQPRGLPREGDETSDFARGYKAFASRCSECHTFEGQGGGNLAGPDLTGYGDLEWTRIMVMAPASPLRYGWRDRNAMPAFRDLESPAAAVFRMEWDQLHQARIEEAGDDEKKKQQVAAATRVVHLGDVERELILRWMFQDGRLVFGGGPMAR